MVMSVDSSFQSYDWTSTQEIPFFELYHCDHLQFVHLTLQSSLKTSRNSYRFTHGKREKMQRPTSLCQDRQKHSLGGRESDPNRYVVELFGDMLNEFSQHISLAQSGHTLPMRPQRRTRL